VPRLERAEIAEHVQGGLPHEIARVEPSAGRGRQTAMRPSLQRRQAPLQQGFHTLDSDVITSFSGFETGNRRSQVTTPDRRIVNKAGAPPDLLGV
jgi:hypothetical protein